MIFTVIDNLYTQKKTEGIQVTELVKELTKQGYTKPSEILNQKLERLSDLDKIFITEHKDIIYKI